MNVWNCGVKSGRRAPTATSHEHSVGTRTIRDQQNCDANEDRETTTTDAKRAFLHADAPTETYVEPPHLRDTNRCWKKCVCGTLPAPAGQHLVQRVGADNGQLSLSKRPCALGYETRDMDMVVHGDEFIVAGCVEGLDQQSQKLNENLDPVQKPRLAPRYDSEAIVLNRCVISDTGLMWKADPRHGELAVAERGLQAGRPKMSPGGAKANAPLNGEEMAACQQDWHTSRRTAPTFRMQGMKPRSRDEMR